MIEYDPEFLLEVWVLFAIGVAVVLLRFAVRIKTIGFKGFQGDDFMTILVLAFFTMDAVTVHIIYFTGTNVEAAALQLTRELMADEIATFELGSKEQLAAWYSYTTLIWCLKAQMLFFFHRLTVIPDPGLKCTLKLQNFIVTSVLNVLTDAARFLYHYYGNLRLIGNGEQDLMLNETKLQTDDRTLISKIAIFLLLCSGIFVITAAIIRVVLTLGENPSALVINRWGVRETIIGIISINIPILRPLFSSNFWCATTYKSNSTSQASSANNSGKSKGTTRSRTCIKITASGKGKSPYNQSLDSFRGMGEDDGQELILQRLDSNATEAGSMGGVTVYTTYEVMTEDIEKGFGDGVGAYGYENANPTWLGNLDVGSSRSFIQATNQPLRQSR
ncbi:hypothetical protein PVAG01_03948 [Phlyctema vagabunda]|uniref:Uncharacterized protein n=1 Tax=Phlyctema vagabunda TaxID=108571 RepID=A0ABR4PMU4_9HELO